jgi:hypothetical protein
MAGLGGASGEDAPPVDDGSDSEDEQDPSTDAKQPDKKTTRPAKKADSDKSNNNPYYNE